MAFLPPVFDGSFEGAAVEVDVYLPAKSSSRSAGIVLMTEPVQDYWSCFENDYIHGLEAGFGCDNAQATMRVDVSQRATVSNSTNCCSNGAPSRGLVSQPTSLSCTNITGRWVTMRLEASKVGGRGRLMVDGTEVATFDTDFDATGTRLKLGSNGPSVVSSEVAFSNVRVYRGDCR
jgi:hypothetical protein